VTLGDGIFVVDAIDRGKFRNQLPLLRWILKNTLFPVVNLVKVAVFIDFAKIIAEMRPVGQLHVALLGRHFVDIVRAIARLFEIPADGEVGFSGRFEQFADRHQDLRLLI